MVHMSVQENLLLSANWNTCMYTVAQYTLTLSTTIHNRFVDEQTDISEAWVNFPTNLFVMLYYCISHSTFNFFLLDRSAAVNLGYYCFCSSVTELKATWPTLQNGKKKNLPLLANILTAYTSKKKKVPFSSHCDIWSLINIQKMTDSWHIHDLNFQEIIGSGNEWDIQHSDVDNLSFQATTYQQGHSGDWCCVALLQLAWQGHKLTGTCPLVMLC